MPDSFKGQDAVLALGPLFNLPMTIETFSIVNKTGGGVVFNVYLISDIYNICISPLNMSLSAGEMYESSRQVIMLATEQIKMQASDIVDYNFNLFNMTP
jgi:hypothetical protein